MIQKRRHVAKTLTWRTLATVSTFMITWGVTGRIEYGMTIGSIDAIIKLFLYMFLQDHAEPTDQ